MDPALSSDDAGTGCSTLVFGRRRGAAGSRLWVARGGIIDAMTDAARPDDPPSVTPTSAADLAESPITVAEWAAHYAIEAPWDIGRPQPAFATLADAGALRGHVLDAGCGTGEHALLAASLGLTVTGVDFVPEAIERARAKAAARGLDARFVVGDALDLEALGERFDTVLDSAVFHVFDNANRARYVAGLAAVVNPGGQVYVLCFSEHAPADWGMRRLTQGQLRATFADGWRVESITPAILAMTDEPAPGWLTHLTRLS
jgi:SAM-dependent methyltransferase